MNNIALFGYGYWGQKVYKTLLEVFSPEQVFIVDPFFTGEKNNLRFISVNEAMENPSIDKVFIVTPEETHYQIVKTCLERGKHVFVEKPLCLKATEAKELLDLAKEKQLHLYVDYTFLFDPYIEKIKDLIDSDQIGEIYQIDSIRHSINIHKPNVTVFDDLATHDIYLGKLFFGQNPDNFSATGEKINSQQINQANLTLNYKNKSLVANYSWAQPIAARKMVFLGTKGSLVWDKNSQNIEKFVDNKLQATYDVETSDSPLKKSIQFFIKQTPISDYYADVKILEKIDELLIQ